MNRLVILCVEDELEVRAALLRDIKPFGAVFGIEEAEEASDARDAVSQCLAAGDKLALVLCDHLLPGETGVSFLVALNDAAETRSAKKVLVTGQAGLDDTVKAVNQAGLDHYVAKPWTKEGLLDVVRRQLTDYVIDHVDDLLPYVSLLDGPRLLDASRTRNRHE